MPYTFEQFEKPLALLLDEFQYQEYNRTGVRRLNGGFATADYDEFDDDYVYFTLKWGVNDGSVKEIHEEQYKILFTDLMDGFRTIPERVRCIRDC
jgi:hypothetical protein